MVALRFRFIILFTLFCSPVSFYPCTQTHIYTYIKCTLEHASWVRCSSWTRCCSCHTATAELRFVWFFVVPQVYSACEICVYALACMCVGHKWSGPSLCFVQCIHAYVKVHVHCVVVAMAPVPQTQAAKPNNQQQHHVYSFVLCRIYKWPLISNVLHCQRNGNGAHMHAYIMVYGAIAQQLVVVVHQKCRVLFESYAICQLALCSCCDDHV